MGCISRPDRPESLTAPYGAYRGAGLPRGETYAQRVCSRMVASRAKCSFTGRYASIGATITATETNYGSTTYWAAFPL